MDEQNTSQTSPADELLVNPIVSNSPAIIKVIGVGGGGGNAVGQMFKEGIEGVRFTVCNTDQKALADSPVPNRLQLGPGLGAGGRPERGSALAEESIEAIRREFDENTRMVFITAGMGGGTGTGASPVVARVAKEVAKERDKYILTVGVVTLPFKWEGKKQIDKALDGLYALAEHVDSMLIINNERLRELYGDVPFMKAFKKADDVLTTAVRSIVEVITMRGKINLDFQDVSTVLRDGGIAIMSTGYGRGVKRVTSAIKDALYSPLLNRGDVYRADKVMLVFTSSSEPGKMLQMEEFEEVENFMAQFDSDFTTKWGLQFDDSMGDEVKVTLLASGLELFGRPSKKNPADFKPLSDEDEEQRQLRRENFYRREGTSAAAPVRRRPKTYIFSVDDLNNEELIAAVEETVAYTRTADNLAQLKKLSAPASAEAPATAEGEAPADDTPLEIFF